MVDLYSQLAGLASEEEYLKRSPFYMGGAALAQSQLPTATSSTQAFLLPLLQGLGSGTLMGLGRDSAADEMYLDAKSSPFSSSSPSFTSAERPEDMTAKQIQAQALLTALSAQNAQEEKLRELDMQKALLPYSEVAVNAAKQKEADKALYKYSTEAIDFEKRKALERAKADLGIVGTSEGGQLIVDPSIAKAKGEIAAAERQAQLDAERVATGGIPLDLLGETGRRELQETAGLMKTMDNVVADIDQKFDKTGTVEFQLKKNFSASDAGKLQAKLDLLARTITKAVEGARPTDYDAATYKKIIQGDWTIPPAKIKGLIQQAQSIFAQQKLGVIEGAKAMASGDLESQLQKYAQPASSNIVTKYIKGVPIQVRDLGNGQYESVD
jgi:hypothetical protein